MSYDYEKLIQTKLAGLKCAIKSGPMYENIKLADSSGWSVLDQTDQEEIIAARAQIEILEEILRLCKQ